MKPSIWQIIVQSLRSMRSSGYALLIAMGFTLMAYYGMEWLDWFVEVLIGSDGKKAASQGVVWLFNAILGVFWINFALRAVAGSSLSWRNCGMSTEHLSKFLTYSAYIDFNTLLRGLPLIIVWGFAVHSELESSYIFAAAVTFINLLWIFAYRYNYSLVPCLIVEANMERKESMKLSKKLMAGFKKRLFCADFALLCVVELVMWLLFDRLPDLDQMSSSDLAFTFYHGALTSILWLSLGLLPLTIWSYTRSVAYLWIKDQALQEKPISVDAPLPSIADA